MEDDEQRDIKELLPKFKKFIPILLLILVLGTFVKIQSDIYNLKALDFAAENSVMSQINDGITQELRMQYPHLPDQEFNQLVAREKKEYMDSNGREIQGQINGAASFFKSKFQDEYNQPYLFAIDPYLYYHQAENYIEDGYWGDEYHDGTSWDTLRYGREEKESYVNAVALSTVWVYNIGLIFIEDFQPMHALFVLPAIMMFLTVILAFFIGKRLAGNLGGFMAGMFLAVNSTLIGRASIGFADTDPFIAFFCALISLLVIHAFTVDKPKHRFFYMAGAAVSTILFSFAWSVGWWYIFDVILFASAIFTYYLWKKKESIKLWVASVGTYAVTSILGGASLFAALYVPGFKYYLLKFLRAPLEQFFWFLKFKEVGIATIWPNVLTTVAELGTSSYQSAIAAVGGWGVLILCAVGALILWKYKKGIVLAFCIPWMIATFYAASTSLRFAAFFALPIWIMAGVSVGLIAKLIFENMEKVFKINKYLALVPIIGLCMLLLVPQFNMGYDVAKQKTPSLDDAWYDTLKGIEADSEDAIITSWWDFGHWFYSISNRRVTFDGGDQERRIHFVGRVLSTDNETEAVNILRMLNCGQEQAYKYLLDYYELMDDAEYRAYEYLQKVIHNPEPPENPALAKLTHCTDIIPQYFIVSEDMVSKAGVWSHFGDWDFNKARMYQDVKVNDISMLDFKIKYDSTSEVYNNIIATDSGDQWSSPWNSYTGLFSCQLTEHTYQCNNGFEYDIFNKTSNANENVFSVIYLENETFKEDILNPDIDGFSAILTEGDSAVAPRNIANSIFTKLFFFDGAGLDRFSKFSDTTTIQGSRVIVYKVDLNG